MSPFHPHAYLRIRVAEGFHAFRRRMVRITLEVVRLLMGLYLSAAKGTKGRMGCERPSGERVRNERRCEVVRRYEGRVDR